MKKYWQTAGAGLGLAAVLWLPSGAVDAAGAPMIEAGEVRSIGETAKVPVVLWNTDYLAHGQVSITAESSSGVKPVSFEPSNLFDDSVFRTSGRIDGQKVVVDFNTRTGEAHRFMDDRIVIGYITYDLSASFTPGKSIELDVSNLTAKGRNNADITLTDLDGRLEHKMPIGDVVGNNQVTATGAIRVLQHVNGDLITEREAFLSGDVDADGLLTQEDARLILEFSTGNRTTFLAVEKKDLANAVLKSEYSEQVQARHGRAPYTYKRTSGSMPSGVTVNAETGKLSGTPTRAGSYKFTIQATDTVGDISTREFTMNVIDSNIVSVEPLNPVNVKQGEKPALPSQVKVTYKDKTTGMENVTWGAVDTSKLGEVTAKGTIGSSGFTVNVKVNVVNENYTQSVKVSFIQILNIYTISVQANAEVYAVTINGLPASYEGGDKFSLASSKLTGGSNATIRLYDKYGNLLETKTQKVEKN